MPLFIIFIVVPLIELMLLLEVGAIIGSGWTFLIIILTAIIGTKLVKQQGVSTWANIQQEIAQGHLPAKAIFDGICILISGVLLITPGFMTDIIGLLLLTPPFRVFAYATVGSKIKVSGGAHNGHTFTGQFSQSHHTDSQSHNPFDVSSSNHSINADVTKEQPTTIDGEYTRKD